MTDFLIRACNQTAVYWGNPVKDGFGTCTYDAPVEIKCRWEYKSEIVSNAKGEEIKASVVVYVLQDLDEGGWLYNGELVDLMTDSSGDSTAEPNPSAVEGAYIIRSFQSIPDIKATVFVRIVYL